MSRLVFVIGCILPAAMGLATPQHSLCNRRSAVIGGFCAAAFGFYSPLAALAKDDEQTLLAEIKVGSPFHQTHDYPRHLSPQIGRLWAMHNAF